MRGDLPKFLDRFAELVKVGFEDCFLTAIATFSLRFLSINESASLSTLFASSSVVNVMKPYLKEELTNKQRLEIKMPTTGTDQ